MALSSPPHISRASVEAYKIPTDKPESDGTLEWDHTTLVVVQIRAASSCGIGYTYSSGAAAKLIHETLLPLMDGRDATAVEGCWDAMMRAIRNLGRPGISSMAIAAVDSALWDLKARLLNLPLVTLPGTGPRCPSDLWQRGLYLIRRARVVRTTMRMGPARH